MKIFIFVLFTLLSANVSAGPYTDFGLGYIQSVPGESESILTMNGRVVVNVNQKGIVDLDSPFLMVRFGYRFVNDGWSDNIHLEYNRFGLFADDTASISSWRAYKRFESDIGFYTDLGVGTVIDVPTKTETETEVEGPMVQTLHQTATIDLNSPFPMVRLGYRWRKPNLHFEYERIGKLHNEHESISTVTIYKRWEWN